MLKAVFFYKVGFAVLSVTNKAVAPHCIFILTCMVKLSKTNDLLGGRLGKILSAIIPELIINQLPICTNSRLFFSQEFSCHRI